MSALVGVCLRAWTGAGARRTDQDVWGPASEENIENVLRVFVCIHKRLEDVARETARELAGRDRERERERERDDSIIG